jgi:uncharacterized membrane protein
VLTQGDSEILAFLFEEHRNGKLTVFIPTAPMDAMGSIQCVLQGSVRELDVHRTAILDCLRYWGLGTKVLLNYAGAKTPVGK